ncbi:hypothetical protein AMECASPLE_028453 [Ameca splendens]|uniref:Uncharacterized protein n=1 Tax=Ameca splendens TaxID=208324 RepID=A0ABV0Y5J6_9TELE
MPRCARVNSTSPVESPPAVKCDTSVNSSLVSHSLYPDLRALMTLAALVDHDLDSYVFRPIGNEQQPDSTSSAAETSRPSAAEPATSTASQQQQSLKVEDSSNITSAQLHSSF